MVSIIRVAERERQRGPFVPKASGSRGPHQLRLKFLFIASLDAFMVPPNRSGLHGSKGASKDSVPTDSIAFCPFCPLPSQTQGASFCSFAPGPQKPPGGPEYNPPFLYQKN